MSMEDRLNGLINKLRGMNMSKKIENAKFAKKWLQQISENKVWSRAIDIAAENTTHRKECLISLEEREFVKSHINSCETQVLINSDKSNKAIEDCYLAGDDMICVLNFASYFNPGGGFMKGAFAQEESLCAVSGLYPVLEKQEVYSIRAESPTPPEYGDEILYSRSVPFTTFEGECGNPYLVDVLSCSAPNCNRITLTHQDYYIKALNKRIEAIYLLPFIMGVEVLILGAWGCGVFKNDPGLISNKFAEVMSKYPGLYKKVVFACGSKSNAEIFKQNIRIM